MQITLSYKDAFFGNYPTLSEVSGKYGSNAAVIWLIPQLFNLSEFCGCKDKLTEEQLEEIARIIEREYYYLKISELAQFFYWFKTGRYGKFYGAVDPVAITIALRDYVRLRDLELLRREQQLHKQQREDWRKNSVTYEQYQQLKLNRHANPTTLH